MSGERERGWYLVGRDVWVTQHVREGIGVTAGQLDDAAVAGIIGVYGDQAGGPVLYQGQADSRSAVPGFTPARRAAVREYEAAIGEVCRLDARVLAAAGQLQPVTIGGPLTRSGLQPLGAA